MSLETDVEDFKPPTCAGTCDAYLAVGRYACEGCDTRLESEQAYGAIWGGLHYPNAVDAATATRNYNERHKRSS